jgi:RNA polymerase sigma factor (sigma-70 family)
MMSAAHVQDDLFPNDLALLTQVRRGEPGAAASLYASYRPDALAVARALTGAHDQAEDLVQEAFASVLAAIAGGAGPVDSFRAYLLATVRHGHYRTARRARMTVPSDDLELFDQAVLGAADPAEHAVRALDSELIVGAFRSLPERWQRVLWSTAIEQSRPRELGAELGITANTAAALAYRARRALARALVRAHVDSGPDRGASRKDGTTRDGYPSVAA